MAKRKNGQANKKSGRAGRAPQQPPANGPEAKEPAAPNGERLDLLLRATPSGDRHIVMAETGWHTMEPDGHWAGRVECIHAGELDLSDATQRNRFVEGLVAKEPRADREQTARSLQELADLIADPPWKATGCEAPVDSSNIIRPEQFFTPEVCGLTVPVTFQVDGKLAPRWRTYLRHAKGKRECRDLEDRIHLPSGSALWVNPVPATPSKGTKSRWSEQGRRDWLAGRRTPPRRKYSGGCASRSATSSTSPSPGLPAPWPPWHFGPS